MKFLIAKLKKHYVNFFFDHPKTSEAFSDLYMLIITELSAIIFAFGFNTFINPNYVVACGIRDIAVDSLTIHQLASCGASGVTQSIINLFKIANVTWFAVETNANIVYWGFYLLLNLPLFILGFKKIGKKFSIFTLINVASVTLWGILLKSDDSAFFINQLSALFIDQPVSRVIFSGVCSGISSALAYVIETSAGGTDVIAYYISERKSVQVGKWSVIINLFIVIVFSLTSTVQLSSSFVPGAVSIQSAMAVCLYTILYMIITSLVVDTINTSNKKLEVQIITPNVNLYKSLIANLPHSCTISDGYGGYSQQPRYFIYLSIRKKELKKVLKIVRGADPIAFVNVIPLENVYGKFYRKRIK
ncbi:MAG: YitT family protein [Bacilli bacterium]